MTKRTVRRFRRQNASAKTWIAIAVTVLLAAGSTVVIVQMRSSEHGATSPSDAIVDPGAQPTSASSSQDYFAPATFEGWSAHDDSSVYTASFGLAKSGDAALRIDNPTSGTESPAPLIQAISVVPSTSYEFSMWVRSTDASEETSPMTLTIGSGSAEQTHSITGRSAWREVRWPYRTGNDEHSVRLAIATTGFSGALLIDDVSAETQDINVVKNGSFEKFTSHSSLDTDSLISKTGTTEIEIAALGSNAKWKVTTSSGLAVASGAEPIVRGLADIPLRFLNQGYYQLHVQVAGGSHIELNTTLMVLNDIDPVKDRRFGVAAHVDKPGYAGSQVPAASIGITGVRTDANWNAIEKVQGNFDFPARYNDAFKLFSDAGIEVLPLSNGSNPLYDGNRTPSSSQALAGFGRVTSAIVGRYGAPAIEIFNEPNTARFNNSTCGVTPQCYLPILQASYREIKAKHPSTVVVGPSIANQDDAWLSQLYAAGGLQALDVVSFHPYVAAPEDLKSVLLQARNRVDEYSQGVKKPIWLTEFGWSSSVGGESEAKQAEFLVRAEVIAFASGIERTYWYDLVNDSVDPKTHESNFGLFRAPTTSNAAFAPKQAAMTQAILIRKIGGKPYVSEESMGSNLNSYVFGSGAAETRVLWSPVSTKVRFATAKSITVTTSLGEVSQIPSVAGYAEITLSASPIYVDGDNLAAVVSVP